MRGEDLLDQRAARTRHAQHEYRVWRGIAGPNTRGEERGVHLGDRFLDQGLDPGGVIAQLARTDGIARRIMLK